MTQPKEDGIAALEDLTRGATARGILPDGLVTVMAGLFIKELLIRGDLRRCLIVCLGNLTEQWQDELYRRFHLDCTLIIWSFRANWRSTTSSRYVDEQWARSLPEVLNMRLYGGDSADFPRRCAEAQYLECLRAAYPIHLSQQPLKKRDRRSSHYPPSLAGRCARADRRRQRACLSR